MEEVIEHLPQRPANYDEVFRLMEPPRALGFVMPSFGTENGCVCIYGEHNGVIKAVGYTGSEWTQIGPTHDNVDELLHGPEEINDAYIDSVRNDLEEIIKREIRPTPPRAQHEAPIGFQLKLCIRHRALSPEDYSSLRSFPQFADTEGIWGNPNAGIVGITVIERNIDPQTNEVTTDGVTFAYYNPDIGTWRIIDTLRFDAPQKEKDNLHNKTKEKLKHHYDNLDMIVGPPENE